MFNIQKMAICEVVYSQLKVYDVPDDSDSEFLLDVTRCGDACDSVEKNNSVP